MSSAVRPQVKQGAKEGWQKTPSLLCRLRGVWHVHWGALELKPAVRGGRVSQGWACSVPCGLGQEWCRPQDAWPWGKQSIGFRAQQRGLVSHTPCSWRCARCMLMAAQWVVRCIAGLILDGSWRPILSLDSALPFRS